MKKDFYRRITHDEIITDYNTKALHTREGTTIVTLQEKLKTKPDNRWTIYFKGSAPFDPFCCRESFVRYLQRALFIFAPVKLSWAKPTFTRYIFYKFNTSLEKSAANHFPEFFLKLLSSYNRLSKQYFVRFLWGAGPIVTLSLPWLLRGLKSSLRALMNTLNSIPR